MGFFGLFKKKEKRDSSAQVVEVSIDDELRRLMSNSLQEEVAMNIPAVASGVNFICEKVAELPLRLYKDNLKGKTEEITDDQRLTLINDETGDLLDPYQMKSAVVRDMLLYGAGYIYPVMFGNSCGALRYVAHRYVSWQKNADPIYKDARCLIGERRFFEDEIIRVCRNSRDGITGMGIVEENYDILETAYKQILFENFLVKKGGNKKGFLQAEQRVDQEVIEDTRKKWEEFYANNESTMMIPNNGLKFVPSSNTSVEMQLHESIKRNNELILQILGLSQKVVSGTATPDEYVTAIKTAVIPVCVAFQTALNRGYLLPTERRQYYWQFDLKQLLKGDILKRYQAYSVALKDGWLQKNEVRYEEDYEPYDFNFITLNLSDVLLDVNNKTLYTPNTNQTVQFGKGGITVDEKSVDNGGRRDIMEERNNNHNVHWTKGEHGYFTGSVGSGGGALGGSGGSSGGENKPDKQDERPVDSNGVPYSRPTLWLPKNEYAHVMGTISTHYDSKFKGKSIGMIELEFDDKWAWYRFEIHGFNEYNIFDKEE